MRRGAARPALRVLTVLVALALVGGCRSDQDPTAMPPTPSGSIAQPSASSVETVTCAPDIVRVVVGQVECSVVVVPERRDDAGAGSSGPSATGRTVRLHLTRILPPGAQTPSGAPILVVGTSLGATPNYLGIAPLAQRAGRDVVVLDARGAGHSTPSLDCPEVHVAAGRTLGVASGPAAAAVEGAVAACAGRLRASGIDLAAYGLDAMVADLEDVRRALDLTDLDLAAYGSTGTVLVPYVHRHADRIRSVVVDSSLAGASLPTPGDEASIVRVVGELLAACRAAEACADAPPLEAARAALAEEPITLPLAPGGGRPDSFVLDEERFLRILRQMTSDGGSSGTAFTLGQVPRFVREVAGRDAEALGRWLPAVLAGQEPFCLGRSPSCLAPRHHLSVGSWLTLMCGDLPAGTPTTKARTLQHAGGSLCGSWPVKPRSTPTSSATPAWSVPTLVLVGRYTTYSSPDALRRAFSGATELTWVEDPAAGNSVVARTPCTLEFRDRWLVAPARTAPPSCLEDLTVRWH